MKVVINGVTYVPFTHTLPSFEHVRDKRMSELTPDEQADAKELWLRDQAGWFPGAEEHLRFLLARLDDVRKHVATLNALRPLWAQGFTDDSVAAQASTAALTQLWGMLGVTNQTEAALRLRKLVDTSNEFCNRVEAGEVRSKRTYTFLSEALGRVPKGE